MGNLEDLRFLDATALAALVRDKSITAAELVDAAIARIEALDPRLNAVVTPMFEEAHRRARGALGGPFAGVPFLLKDLLAEYAGVRLAEGSRFLSGRYVSPVDSELVARYKRAGLVVVGKSNTPELGVVPTTEPRLAGPTRNPWDLRRTPGGSSGGSAAAVAAGLVPAAHGNDGGGSIRVPAACCGLFGLKPTRGRNPLGPHYGDGYCGLVAEHVITRSVRDSAGLLDATAGADHGDPYGAAPPARPFAAEVGAEPGRLRIAVSTAPVTAVPVHADCLAAVADAARLARDLGHEVVEAAPALDGEMLTQAFLTLWSAGTAWAVEDWARRTGRAAAPEDFEPLTWALVEIGRRRTAAELLLGLQDLQRISRDVGRFFATYDVWLTPTAAEPPPPLGEFESADDALHGLRRAARFVPFTPIANVTGQPAMSVPLHWADGLPIGTHWIGRYGDEATLFRLAAQLEAARPWARRRPSGIA